MICLDDRVSALLAIRRSQEAISFDSCRIHWRPDDRCLNKSATNVDFNQGAPAGFHPQDDSSFFEFRDWALSV